MLLACIMQMPALTLTDAILTLTATVMTPTITATPIPNTARLVEILNRNLVGADPLADTVDARYSVLDVQFAADAEHNLVTLKVNVECECVYSSCCSTERTFVQLMHAMVAKPKTMDEIRAQIPATIVEVQVAAFDHMQPRGTILVQWADVLLYAAGQINGNQLGARIVRLAP